MSYLVIRDGSKYDKTLFWLVSILFILSLFSLWFHIPTSIFGIIFTITIFISIVHVIMKRIGSVASEISPVITIAQEKVAEMESNGMSVTPENITKAVQEEVAKNNGVSGS